MATPFGVATWGVGGTGQAHVACVGVIVGNQATNMGFGLTFICKCGFIFLAYWYIGGFRVLLFLLWRYLGLGGAPLWEIRSLLCEIKWVGLIGYSALTILLCGSYKRARGNEI